MLLHLQEEQSVWLTAVPDRQGSSDFEADVPNEHTMSPAHGKGTRMLMMTGC